jgi:hypothetical protein
MSSPEAGVAGDPGLESGRGRSFRAEQLVLLALVLLSGIGIAISDASRDRGYRYWLAMTPVFGVLSAVAAASEARRGGGAVAPAVGREALHWSGAAVAVSLVYLLEQSGRIAHDAAGLVALLALALSSYLAGIRANWRFCAVGAILACAVAAAAVVERFLWMIALLTLLAAAGTALLWMRARRAKGGVA